MNPIPHHPELFRDRRERFLAGIGDGVAILPAAPMLLRSRDTGVPYRQDSDLHYLTGFPEAGAVAVLTPHDPERRFTLFVRPRDPERELWDGPLVGVEGAMERFGADAAFPIDELDAELRGMAEPADAIWYAARGDGGEMDRRALALLVALRGPRARTGRGPRDLRDPAAVLWPMRLIKDDAEIALLRAAATASARGHLAGMRAGRPGAGEWEVQAAMEAVFRAASPGDAAAYPSIVAAGSNGTVLHYVANDSRIHEGDLVLVDAGAEFDLYAGDITRTWPASGRFSEPQRRVYDIVAAALDAGIEAARPGAPSTAPHEAARRVLTAGMVELGLLEGEIDALIEDGSSKRYFMHNTSHWLGLDVHDVGDYRDADGEPIPLAPGMVLTVEPGLYIGADDEDAPEALRGIAVRLEDDVLITADGCEVLTREVPVAVDEVERICSGG
jgi:Xaa-Pro aminopeptidase